MTPFTVIIPARHASTRLPGKPLLPLAGRPVIEHVWQTAVSSGADRVIVATDHAGIRDCAMAFGAEVCMTGTEHRSGTERIAEVVGAVGMDDDAIIVNLQGDEPLMPSYLLVRVADTLAEAPESVMATLSTSLIDADELHDPHAVKLVAGHDGRALYFSRAAIPWDREGHTDWQLSVARRHLGLYAYRAGFLKRYSMLPQSPLEGLEQLEQLRVLQAGERIQVAEVADRPGHGIDTERDLAAAEAALNQRAR
ncbi:3-deoxy-manno-octulosonate cytidylyltransferase [Spiribacter onubensis]|uniref:3-deoxy-manno-octulosonate cytidylyltransferase n=1 Tax=Spiribacter onubensis TaxID=3122420 RepID=A0ABV3SAY9_9GAMM